MKRLNFFAGGFGQLNFLCRIYRNDLMKNKKKNNTTKTHGSIINKRKPNIFVNDI